MKLADVSIVKLWKLRQWRLLLRIYAIRNLSVGAVVSWWTKRDKLFRLELFFGRIACIGELYRWSDD